MKQVEEAQHQQPQQRQQQQAKQHQAQHRRQAPERQARREAELKKKTLTGEPVGAFYVLGDHCFLSTSSK